MHRNVLWLSNFSQKSSSSEGSVASSTKKWDYRHLAAVYALYAWGLPLCIVIVARVMDLLSIGIRPDFGVERCWFSGTNQQIQLHTVKLRSQPIAGVTYYVKSIVNLD